MRTEIKKEIWLPVVGYEGFYEVSQFGRVRSIDRDAIRKAKDGSYHMAKHIGRVLKPCRSRKPKSYSRVTLSKPKIGVEGFTIHRIVLEAFVGPRPPGMECRHLDGNRQNNVLRNLMWGTKKENADDKKKHGTQRHLKGELNGRAKLTERDVKKIRQLEGKMTQKEIASLYGVSRMHVHCIFSRKTWHHL